MRLFQRFSLALALLQLTIAAGASLAAPITFGASGSQVTSFEGDIPVRSIGGVSLPKGSVSISGNTIEVSAVPEWLFDKHTVLTGVLINPTLNTTGDNATITGLAYFQSGEWVKNLGRNQASEVINTTDGLALSGHVGGVTDTTLELLLTDGTRKSLALKQIESIVSPRAFSISMPASSIKIEPSDKSYQADAPSISFTPAMFHSGVRFLARGPQVPKSLLPGTEGGISNKILAQMVVTDIVTNTIAPAIAIPIIFRGPTLRDQQLLHQYSNAAQGQPIFAPQFYKDGSVSLYPFTTNRTLNYLLFQQGLNSGNPLF